MRLYVTRAMEQTAHVLGAKYERVLIRSAPKLNKPIRFRPRMVPELNLRLIPRHNPKPYLDKWEDEGGNALYYCQPMRNERIPQHHAQLITECPISQALYDIAIRSTVEACVVYIPPTWDEHKRYVMRAKPPAAICERVWSILNGKTASAFLCELTEMPGGCHVAQDEEICQILGIDHRSFRYARRVLVPWDRYRKVIHVALRVMPDEPILSKMFTYINENCPKAPDGTKFVIEDVLSECIGYWRTNFSMLARRGHIDVIETLGVYDLRGVDPDWFALDERNAKARADLQEMIELIEKAALYA
jgi:hypothetical protein